MSANVEFKLVVVESGKEIASKALSYEDVYGIISGLQDNDGNSKIFEVASKHAASNVREQAASKDHLSEVAIKALVNDPSINVVRSLVRSQKFKGSVDQKTLEMLIDRDPEVAQSIAGDLDSFSEADQNSLAQKLASHSDLTVLNALASSYNTPKKILKALSSHSDPYIASQAKEQLDNS